MFTYREQTRNTNTKNNDMRQIDLFEWHIDKLIEESSLTKAQILSAFHKANKNSLDKIEAKSMWIRRADWLMETDTKAINEILTDFFMWFETEKMNYKDKHQLKEAECIAYEYMSKATSRD